MAGPRTWRQVRQWDWWEQKYEEVRIRLDIELMIGFMIEQDQDRTSGRSFRVEVVGVSYGITTSLTQGPIFQRTQ